MAEARVRLTSEVGSLVRGVRQARMSFQDLHDTVRNNWWGIQNVGAAFAAVGGAIAMGTAASVKAASAFELGMVGVARTTRETGQSAEDAVKNIGPLSDALLDLSTTRPVEIGRLQAIAEEAGALGVKQKDIVGFTRGIVDLVAATNLTDQSATQLARIMGVMNVDTSQVNNLGSAIMEVGTSVAATETEIVNFATRLSSTARIANFSAGELVAVSGALLSLGSRAEAGASAMQRTVLGMANALASGSEEAAVFAKVAGFTGPQAVEQFAAAFRKNGYQALTLYIEGLASLGDNAEAVSQTMRASGITEVRQTKALQELAAGVRTTSNEYLSLREVGQLGNQSFREGTATIAAAEEVSKTAAAQYIELKNSIKAVAITIGSMFLPVIKPVLWVLTNFAAGLRELPAPLKYIGVVAAGAFGIFSAGAAAFLLIGQRLVLVRGAFEALRSKIFGTTQAVAAESAAASAAAGTNARLAQAKGAVAGAAGAATGAVNALAGAEAKEGAAAAANAATTARMTQADWAAAQAKGRLAGASAAAIPGLNGYAGATDRTTQATGRAAGGSRIAALWYRLSGQAAAVAAPQIAGLAAANAAAGNAAGAAAVKQAGFMAMMGRGAGKAGAALGKLKNPYTLLTAAILLGSAYTIKQGNDARNAAKKNGELGGEIADLGTGLGDAADATDELSDSQKKAADEVDNLSERISEQNSGLEALYETQLSVKEAQLDLADAQRELAEARADAAERDSEIADGERDLATARRRQQKATEDIAKAERALETAREDQRDDLIDAEFALLDARDKHIDSLEKVREAQEALDELNSGPTVRQLTDATNKLVDAQHRLRNANQKVSDTQWYLNYLMEEGASARDIQDAQYALADANLEVSESASAVADAEEELNDLREVTPEERAEAERELASAIRDSEKALRDIQKREQNVADLRRDIANDTAYKQAQQDLADAHRDAQDAARDVADAERDLRAARAGTEDADRLAQAELGYERSLYAVAKAQADAEIAARRARGEQIGAAEEARILARHLRNVGATAEGPARDGMLRYAAALGGMRDEVSKSVADANKALAGLGDFPAPNMDFLDEMINGVEEGGKEAGEKGGKGMMSSLWGYIKDNIGEIIISAVVVGLTGLALAAFGVPAGLIALAGLIVSVLVTGIFAVLPDSFKTRLNEFFTGIPGWFRERWDDIKDVSAGDAARFFLGVFFGIPGKIFGQLWKELQVGKWIREIFNRDKTDADRSGKNSGQSIAGQMWSGFQDWVRRTFNIRGLIGGIFNRERSGTGQDSFSWGNMLGSMLRGGLLGSLGGLGGALRGAIGGALSALPNWIKGPINGAIGIYNGFIERIAGMGYKINPVKVMGKTVFPGLNMNFGFMRSLKVPFLADGGITTGPTLAMVGESGSEAIIPIDRLMDSFRSIDALALQLSATNQALAALAAGGVGGGGGDTFNLTALTDADPVEIADEFMWAKRVRSR